MGILYYGQQLTPTTFGISSITGPTGSPQSVVSGIEGPYSSGAIGTTLYFEGSDGTHGYQLWETNGTTPTMLTNINDGGGGSFPFGLTNVNGTIFFGAYNGTQYQLWKSDGTPAGTQVVAANLDPYDLVAYNGSLSFLAYNGTSDQLYTSNGQTSGTVPITTFAAGTSPEDLAKVNGELYFSVSNGTNSQLWESDGTALNTVQVSNFSTTFFAGVSNITGSNGKVFFTASTPTQGDELWVSDGTTAGTQIVDDIYPGTTGSSPYDLTNVNGELFFAATDPTDGTELWKSNGTTLGTQLVSDINPGAGSSNPENLTSVNGELYFTASDGTHNPGELFRSDGTSGGTVLVDSSSSAPYNDFDITNVNGNVYFYGTTNGTTYNLYDTQGTGETLVASNVVPPDGIAGISTNAASDVIGNGVSDVVLQNGGGVVDWIMNDGAYQSGNVLTTAATGWDVVGTGDFSGNGVSDVLLQNGGSVVDWIMNNGN
jgi:ELWxxDGT repeat protein